MSSAVITLESGVVCVSDQMALCGYEDPLSGPWATSLIMVKGMHNAGVETRGTVSLIRSVLVIAGFKIVQAVCSSENAVTCEWLAPDSCQLSFSWSLTRDT